MRSVCIIAALSGALLATTPARAVDAPFDPALLRLSEILGSLHFLRNLCGESGMQWRDKMEQIITAENPDEARKAKFIASFNRGYRSFQASYKSCTASAIEAINRYTREGAQISSEVAGRYGN